MYKTEREPPNAVHQNAILCETVSKENRHQRIYTTYSVNPFRKSKFVDPSEPNLLFDADHKAPPPRPLQPTVEPQYEFSNWTFTN